MNWNELFECKDGKLYWKIDRSRGKARKGDLAGSRHSGGYWSVYVSGREYMAHRIIWEMYNGPIPSGMQVDHINHNRDDNRPDNLRIVSCVVNHRNRPKNENNTSGVTGVIWCKTNGKWIAQIGVDGKMKRLGSFIEKNDAIKARKEAEVKFGFHDNHGK